jgi:hypothetical protein
MTVENWWNEDWQERVEEFAEKLPTAVPYKLLWD